MKDGNDFLLRTTEIIYANGSKTECRLVLPRPKDGHCMVEYAGIIIIIGGSEYATNYGWFQGWWKVKKFGGASTNWWT